ncbi:MAG: ATP-binding cassette domain-containing protein, partial [Planctomycetota bacterium]|nr:ATP-binding cassette domain-containing protein [Planctomycetota bacterium]
AEITAEVDRVLTELDIVDVRDARIGDATERGVSGGQRKRVSVGQELVSQSTHVLFLDEPTTGLDPTSRQALWEEVRRLNAEVGTTVFLTTQYLEEADQLAGRVAIIDGGRLVREGTPTELKATVGAPTLRVEVDQEHVATTRDVMTGFGEERPAREGRVAIGLSEGAAQVAAVVRALDTAGVTVNHLELDAPSLD